MKKWIFIILAIVIVAISAITGIVLSNDSDSSFVFNISAITIEVNSAKDIEYKSSDACDVSFKTENENIATVTAGKIFAHNIGKTYLNAEIKHNTKTHYRSVLITVVEEKPEYYFSYQNTRHIYLGDETSFAPTITKGNVNAMYSTSDSSIATIDAEGKINTLKCGEVDINVLIENQVVKTCHVTISAKFTINSVFNCEVSEYSISVSSGQLAAISISLFNHKGEDIISNYDYSISTTNDIEFSDIFSRIEITAINSGEIIINYENMNTTLILNVNVI